MFNKFNKDKGGSIDADELGSLVRVLGLVNILRCYMSLINKLFQRLNPTNKEIYEIANEVDEDGNGEIEFEEFLKIMNSTKLRYGTSP